MGSALGANGNYFAGEFGYIRQNGGADDGPKINQALTYISELGGGRLIFSPGVTVGIGTTVLIPANCELVIPRSCTFKALAGLTGSIMIQIANASSGIIGNGVLDGFGLALNCVNVHGATKTILQGIQVKGATQHGILTDGSAVDGHYDEIDARNNSVGNAGVYFGIAFAGTASHNITTNCRGTDDLGAAGTQESGWGEVAGMTGDYNVYSGCDFTGNVSASPPPTVGANSGSTTTGSFSGATLTNPSLVGTLTAPADAGSGGSPIAMVAGAGGAGGNGGAGSLTGGAGTSNNRLGGPVSLIGGAGNGNGNGGAATVAGGASGGGSAGGAATLRGGLGSGTSVAPSVVAGGTGPIGAHVTLTGGSALGLSGQAGGQIQLVSGIGDGAGLTPLVAIDGSGSVPTAAVLAANSIGFRFIPGTNHVGVYANNAGVITFLDLGLLT